MFNKKFLLVSIGVVVVLLVSTICYLMIVNQVGIRNEKITKLQSQLNSTEKAKSPIADAIDGYEKFNSKVRVTDYEPYYTWFTDQPAWTQADKNNSDKNAAEGKKLTDVTSSVRSRIAYLENEDKSLVEKWANDTRDWVNGLHFYKNDVYTYDSNKIDKKTLDDYVDKLKGRSSVLGDKISEEKTNIDKEKANKVAFFF